MSHLAASRLRYLLHGVGVELNCQVPVLLEALGQRLGEFMVSSLVGKASPVRGWVRPFNHDEVRAHLSPSAARVATANDLIELYQEDERFWLIDDHWGMCEMNVLRGQWRSWVLTETTFDAFRIIEQAVLWPMAQLLRRRGLSLLPSASVVRDEWGVLLLSTYSLEPELSALVHAGFKLIGQSWTALREQSGGIAMYQMPGHVQNGNGKSPPLDLTREFPGSRCESAWCDTVMLMSAGRRPLSNLRAVSPTNALTRLRRAWPLTELDPQRRAGQLPARMAHRCRVFEAQLSRKATDILSLLERARYQRPAVPAVAERVA